MSATGAGYDLSSTTFSPNGTVFQTLYAFKAVENSGQALGVRCKDGVVLGVEKAIVSKLLVRESNRRVHTCDPHAGLVLSGMAADARQLVNRARSEARAYRKFYGSEIPGRVLAERIAAFAHMYTIYWYLRPFGASVLLATYDEDAGPELYNVLPSGNVNRYRAAAIGKHCNGAQTELEKIDFETVTCREAVKHIARIIYKLHDDIKDKDFELELSWVCDESNKKHVLVPEDIRQEAVTAAKELKNAADMEDSDSD